MNLLALNPMTLFSALPGNIAQGMIWGIMAIGVYMTFRLLRFSDLTVDGSFATGGAVAVMLIINGVPAPAALLVSFCTGMLAGLVTGLLHTAFGIPDILSGILSQIALYSINLRIMDGKANQAVSGQIFFGGVPAEYSQIPDRGWLYCVGGHPRFVLVFRYGAWKRDPLHRMQPRHVYGSGNQYQCYEGSDTGAFQWSGGALWRPSGSVSGLF